MARLLDVVATLEMVRDEGEPWDPVQTIFARLPWSPQSDALVLQEEAVGGVAPSTPEYAYLLEVFIAREVLKVWSTWRDGAVPTPEQATRAVIHYAEYDAYQPAE